MSAYSQIKETLTKTTYTWLITGVAGFIGSHLLEALLKLNQKVVGLDNFSTGYQSNLDAVKALVNPQQWQNFYFVEGDICDGGTCHKVVQNVDFVLHEAALGSVPRSLKDPIKTNAVNVDGFLNMLVAARDAKVKRFIYAASSSTYGDHPALPKVENQIGKPLSPYAVTKYVNELYADVFSRTFALASIGLRYFNVFGPRQDPNGAYAAVIPKWTAQLLKGIPIEIYGDGETSRDFTYVENIVQLNLLAAMTQDSKAINQVYNGAVNGRTSLNQLYQILSQLLGDKITHLPEVIYRDFRAGDVRHSQADITKAKELLGYFPTHEVNEGLKASMSWYGESATLSTAESTVCQMISRKN